MTTIAIDRHGTIAADGMRTWGGDIVGREEEKIRVRHGRIYALTGTYPVFEALIAWHAAGADPEKTPKLGGDNSWTLIAVEGPAQIVKYTNTCPYPEDLPAPIAFGAGIDLAKGAMLAGASAREAVEIVAAHTDHTGGRVRSYDIAMTLAGAALAADALARKEAAE